MPKSLTSFLGSQRDEKWSIIKREPKLYLEIKIGYIFLLFNKEVKLEALKKIDHLWLPEYNEWWRTREGRYMIRHLSKPIEPLITKSDLSCMQKKKKK